jgi:hypothetical protein
METYSGSTNVMSEIETLLQRFYDENWKYDETNFGTKYQSLLKLDKAWGILKADTFDTDVDLVSKSQRIIADEGLNLVHDLDVTKYGGQVNSNPNQYVRGSYVLHEQIIYVNLEKAPSSDFPFHGDNYTYVHELAHHFDQTSRLLERVKLLTNVCTNKASRWECEIDAYSGELVAIAAAHIFCTDLGMKITRLTQSALGSLRKQFPMFDGYQFLDRTETCYDRLVEAFSR